MPCMDYNTPRFGYDDDRYKVERVLRKRNDALAAELCKTRALLLRVADIANVNKLSESDMALLEAAEKAQRAHRAQDKKAALADARDRLKTLKRKVEQVEALGGLPSPAQRRKLKALRNRIKRINASNPLATDLY